MKKNFEILSMVVLLVWGGVFLYFYFSGRVNDLLTSSFRPWVPIAGVGMIILGLLNLINASKPTGACTHDHAHGDHTHCDHEHHDHTHGDHEHDDHAHCDHEHHDHKHCDHEHGDHHHRAHAVEAHGHEHEETSASSLAFALVVLLVPLLTAAKYSTETFSGEYTKKWLEIEREMQSLRQRQIAGVQSATGDNPYTAPTGDKPAEQKAAWPEFTIEDLKKMVPQTTAGDFLLEVPQIYYTAGDQELMKVMEGISIVTTAQVIEDTVENSSPKRLRAYRLLIECCAADARPISIPIDFAEALPEYKEMGWYKLIGRLHFHKSEDNEFTPILQIKNFQPTPEPTDWMAY